jgi:hemerythrin
MDLSPLLAEKAKPHLSHSLHAVRSLTGAQMPMIKWDANLDIGVDYIDDQHKQLVHAINELSVAVKYGMSKEVIEPITARLFEYASVHFLAEEQLLTDLEYAGIDEHKKQHQDFITAIRGLNKQFSYNKDFLAIHIQGFLLEWFYEHIRTKDMEYRQFMLKNRGGKTG